MSLNAVLGTVPASIIADGTGYDTSAVSPVGFSGTGPATVQRISAAGTLSGLPETLPFSLDGAALALYPDGRLLVSGATRTPQLNTDGTTSCVAPYTARVARLLPS